MAEETTGDIPARGFISVRRTRGQLLKEEQYEDVTIRVNKFETEPAYVSVSMGATKNMGNFESMRIDVGLRVPCYLEEINEVERLTSEWVDNVMTSKMEGADPTTAV